MKHTLDAEKSSLSSSEHEFEKAIRPADFTEFQGQENIVVMMSRDPAKFKAALKIG